MICDNLSLSIAVRDESRIGVVLVDSGARKRHALIIFPAIFQIYIKVLL
jgi:hypothetical protein